MSMGMWGGVTTPALFPWVGEAGSLTAAAEQQPHIWLNASSSRHEPPTRPISKAEALGWETRSTSCSRGPTRQLAYIPLEGDSSQTRGESSVRKQVAILRHPSTLSRKVP